MSQAPIMPIFTDAYLADTLHLSTEEHGAYLLLLFATWRNNGQPLADDPRKLSRIVRVSERRWVDKIRPSLAPFFDLSGGSWRQMRLENAWADVAKRSASFAERGAKGGRPKLLKDKETDKAVGFENEKLHESIQNHNQNHNQNHKEERKKDTGAVAPDPVPKNDSGFEGFYQAFPKRVGRGAALRAYRSAIKKTTPGVILAGAKRYADDPNRKPEFTKHPASWLNGEHWADETESAKVEIIHPRVPLPEQEWQREARERGLRVAKPEQIAESLAKLRGMRATG